MHLHFSYMIVVWDKKSEEHFSIELIELKYEIAV